ncbi:MAG TPA: endopeptidase La [Thermoanaerobaculia bacterium]|nr:endopeptidase La [Thermoanaerobaculia bacterium]
MSPDEHAHDETPPLPDLLPVLPLRDMVLFPFIILPLSVAREKSISAVDRSLAENRMLMLVAQKDPATEDPQASDLFDVGTAASITRMLKLPDGRIRILVQGVVRARVVHLSQTEPFLQAKIEQLADRPGSHDALEAEALVRSVRQELEKAVQLGKSISPEVMVIVANLDDPGRLADLVASNLELKLADAQAVLEELDPVARLRKVAEVLGREMQLLAMQQEIASHARDEMDKTQREYFLRQQLKAIQQELGEGDDLAEEIVSWREKAEQKLLPEAAKEELERQIKRLERSHPDSAEAAITRTYLEWLIGMPWGVVSEDRIDLAHARQVLDEDHYDLEKIKERIVEYLAVRKLKADAKGPILCFVGPPGVGKTSLGRSIARALGRQFVRISLGGVRDEAEIRGHRRTYVGALPGRVLQGLNQAETSNPVFMLDEIDKLGADYRGDPSAALLEVLDPEQNDSFRDHYLGLEYDLSRVMFIATANLLEPVHPAFLDRMEVVRLSGYTEEEKLHIARAHLIPKLLERHGITAEHVGFTDSGLHRIVGGYTREAGLRNFEREMANICRKVAVRVAEGKPGKVVVDARRVERVLGPPRHRSDELLDRDRVGVATGLAWTETGGDLLFIEVVAVPGKGKLLLTGQLGEVMKESAQAALSFARAHAAQQGLETRFFADNDLHVHVPAGSIPKDGPSAGITIAAAIVSALTHRPINRRLALTGEITLRGTVLPIGGLKEKVLAAKLAGIDQVVLPKLNERDLAEVPAVIRKGLTFHFAEHMEEVLHWALLPTPVVGNVVAVSRGERAALPS